VLRRAGPLVLLLLALAGVLAPGSRRAVGQLGTHLWVDGGSPVCSDGYSRRRATSTATPWCSIVRAAAEATPGDTVRIRPWSYRGSLRLVASNTTYIAEGDGVIVDAAGEPAAIKLHALADVTVDGIAVTGAAVQGIWASGVQRITLSHLRVSGNGGAAVQVLSSSGVTVRDSVITGNGGAGIFEGNGSTGCVYVGNHITTNGVNGQPYNGDGIQLGGAGAYVSGNTITGNGDPGPYEHGIYTGPASTDFVIEGNVVSGNAGSNIKAAGAGGTIRYNRLEGGRLGLVFSDNPAPVTAYYNLVFGEYQHAVFLTAGNAPARARLWNNTLVVTARNGTTGDASAVFVNGASLLDLRNNLISYTHADNAGSAVNVPVASRVARFTSDNNWFSSMQSNGRHLIWNGSRMTLSQWRRSTGRDGAGLASVPPALDADAHVASTNLGWDAGRSLGLTRDYIGTPVAGVTDPDIGAYEEP
jgi:hypothetical protein